ncbi:2Fe-2S iron-sulfur cluster-binding protein, partial [Bordetella hinzii]|nr:2Fe-2S iron-sulfur cluster-binding protein [Bordetella hinzii]
MSTEYEVLLLPSGWRFRAGADTPVLRAAKAAGIRLPSSCRNGSCRACMCKMESGR